MSVLHDSTVICIIQTEDPIEMAKRHHNDPVPSVIINSTDQDDEREYLTPLLSIMASKISRFELINASAGGVFDIQKFRGIVFYDRLGLPVLQLKGSTPYGSGQHVPFKHLFQTISEQLKLENGTFDKVLELAKGDDDNYEFGIIVVLDRKKKFKSEAPEGPKKFQSSW